MKQGKSLTHDLKTRNGTKSMSFVNQYHKLLLPNGKKQEQASDEILTSIEVPADIEPLMRQIFFRLGLDGSRKLIELWLQGCDPSHGFHFFQTARTIPDYWPPECDYVPPLALDIFEMSTVALHLLRADLKFRRFDFSIPRLQESTANVVGFNPKEFYHDAPQLISTLYQLRCYEMRWYEGANIETATVKMPKPNDTRGAFMKKHYSFDLELRENFEVSSRDRESKKFSPVAPSSHGEYSEVAVFDSTGSQFSDGAPEGDFAKESIVAPKTFEIPGANLPKSPLRQVPQSETESLAPRLCDAQVQEPRLQTLQPAQVNCQVSAMLKAPQGTQGTILQDRDLSSSAQLDQSQLSCLSQTVSPVMGFYQMPRGVAEQIPEVWERATGCPLPNSCLPVEIDTSRVAEELSLHRLQPCMPLGHPITDS